MEITCELIGIILQTLGVGIVLGSQVVFVWKARKRYGNLGTAFLEIQSTRVYMNNEKVKETVKDKQKLKEALEKFPHAKLLYDDFKITVIGLVVTIVGLILSMFEGSIVIS